MLSTSAEGQPHDQAQRINDELARLRERLQGVVQGVREVADGLDEPHSLIANVRDQLASSGAAGLSRNVDASAVEQVDPSSSVRARVAAVERQASDDTGAAGATASGRSSIAGMGPSASRGVSMDTGPAAPAGDGGELGANAALVAATANAAAAAAYLEAHPETLRELWTLRARVRAQEAELASMVKQLSNKNAQLDAAQAVVAQREREAASLTDRLSEATARLSDFQLAQQLSAQQQHAASALRQDHGLSAPRPSADVGSGAPREQLLHDRDPFTGRSAGPSIDVSLPHPPRQLGSALPASLPDEPRPHSPMEEAPAARRGGSKSRMRRLLAVAPYVACGLLLVLDSSVQRRLLQLRSGLAKAFAPPRAPQARKRRVQAAVAKPALPGPPDGAFESPVVRECKAHWCKIIRPPPPSAIYY